MTAVPTFNVIKHLQKAKKSKNAKLGLHQENSLCWGVT